MQHFLSQGAQNCILQRVFNGFLRGLGTLKMALPVPERKNENTFHKKCAPDPKSTLTTQKCFFMRQLTHVL